MDDRTSGFLVDFNSAAFAIRNADGVPLVVSRAAVIQRRHPDGSYDRRGEGAEGVILPAESGEEARALLDLSELYGYVCALGGEQVGRDAYSLRAEDGRVLLVTVDNESGFVIAVEDVTGKDAYVVASAVRLADPDNMELPFTLARLPWSFPTPSR